MRPKIALFSMPRSSRAWKGANGLWVTVAGWAAAAESKWGHAMIGTADNLATAKEVLTYPLESAHSAPAKVGKGWKSKLLPAVLITAIKDWKLKRSQPKTWPIEKSADWENYDVQFVWEQHDLFKGPGKRIASKLNAPLILYVHAPVVWEASKWGVKRPIWGSLLEKYVEAKNLKEADLVACVSEEVRQKVIQMGVDSNKTMVAPMSVDEKVFDPSISGTRVREQYNLKDDLVVGWVGSFRSFHGLDSVVEAFNIVKNQFTNAKLLLVGDGFEKKHIEELVQQLGLEPKVFFAGKQPITEIPYHVAAFDVALVSANSAENFHYSPHKMIEYLAMGKATIAPAAGDIPNTFPDGKELLLYTPGDAKDLAQKMISLLESKEKRNQLAAAAIQYVSKNGLWIHELNKAIQKLN